MKRYNPIVPPNPAKWLAMPEQERIDLVTQYHRKAGFEIPKMTLHATLHVVAENQIAMGDKLPVKNPSSA